jgi:hypothetical protein
MKCVGCGQENEYELCDACHSRASLGPAKHMTRNPVDIQRMMSNTVSAIGQAYDANKEAKRERAAAESENQMLRSTILSQDKIIADQSKEIDNLEALVNEMRKRISLASWIAYILGALTVGLCFFL